MNSHIIAFTGPRRVGKSLTCQILKNYYNIEGIKNQQGEPALIISFADPLRDFIKNNFGKETYFKTKTNKNDLVFTKIENIGVIKNFYFNFTYRDLLIKTANYLRSLDNEIFCKCLEEKINNIEMNKILFSKFNEPNIKTPAKYIYLIDDLRDETELNFLRTKFPYLKTTIIKLNRKDNLNISEKDLEANDFLTDEVVDFVIETEYTENTNDYFESLLPKFKNIGII